MIPQGVEIRPELQIRSDVLAFGFAGERVADEAAVNLLSGELLNHISAAAESAETDLVVVDMRNVQSLSTTGLGRLLALRKRLSQVRWKPVLLISDAIIREVFFTTDLHDLFLVAANEAELREIVNRYAPIGPQSPHDVSTQFSESELAEMEADGITLDDAIRVVEGMRR
jgi:anti-anti-sigma factor